MGDGESRNIKRYADVISGSVLVLIALVMLIQTRNIRALRIMEFGPKVMPRIYSIVLAALGVGIAISGAIRTRKSRSPSQNPDPIRINFAKVFLTMGLIALYVAGLRPFGFLVTSIIYLFSQIAVLGGATPKWRLLVYAGVAVAVSFGIFLLFDRVFNVFLPPGRIW